jgi:hypothetical protein
MGAYSPPGLPKRGVQATLTYVILIQAIRKLRDEHGMDPVRKNRKAGKMYGEPNIALRTLMGSRVALH